METLSCTKAIDLIYGSEIRLNETVILYLEIYFVQFFSITIDNCKDMARGMQNYIFTPKE